MKKAESKHVKTTLEEVAMLRKLMNRFINIPELSPASFVSYLEFSDAVDKYSEDRQKGLDKIASTYGVAKKFMKDDPTTFVYDYAEHEKCADIDAKMKAVMGKEVTVSPATFLSPAEFQKLTHGLHFDTVKWLRKFLLK